MKNRRSTLSLYMFFQDLSLDIKQEFTQRHPCNECNLV